jgi:hypothetical protein
VPQFSSEDTPLSQEAQLMAIGRQLQRNHTEFIVINASNVLDQIFLAQFLRRACPDARLVLPGGDLLYEREAQNTPFIGAVSFSPYGLMSLTSTGRQGSPAPVRAFADSTTEAYFNAASFTFWNGKATSLHLANYFNPLQPGSSRHASLWETTIGTDGYYPLAIVDDCASNVPLILPTISSPSLANPHVCEAAADTGSGSVLRSIAESLHAKGGDRSGHPYRYPAQSWQALCILIGLPGSRSRRQFSQLLVPLDTGSGHRGGGPAPPPVDVHLYRFDHALLHGVPYWIPDLSVLPAFPSKLANSLI